jgi:diguanylate cyclase (GGDEF)-like protein
MRRRIAELLLLEEFNAAIGTLLDPHQACTTACSWLGEVLRWEVLTLSTTGRDARQYRYRVWLNIDGSVSEICHDLDAGTGYATGNAKPSKSGAGDMDHDVISVCFPDGTGMLAVSRESVRKSQFSDEFVEGVAQSLARSLSNAREYAKLKTLSTRDHLTGLYNRRVFEEMLEVEARRRTSNPFSLLLIDLDNFKVINDTYGHGAGDEALVSVAEMLRINLRKTDVPARYGGDEFALLLPEASLESAQRIGERFRECVAARPIVFGNSKILPTVSVGIASVSDRARLNVAHMVEETDRALYRAKASGRNRVCAVPMSSHIG